MGNNRLDIEQKARVNFVCTSCGHRFFSPPGKVVDTTDRPWHPWSYYADCPECGSESYQAAWEINLLKAHQNATGPVTKEGLARTAQNLEGHPTPQETLLTRFNAMRHGLFARVATYFPAKPGNYPHCEGCEYLEDEACRPQRACLKRTELFLRHQTAFETQDPTLLTQLRADTQSAIQALINDMILAIAQDGGPRITSPEYYYDKDGGCHFVKYTNPSTGDEEQLMKLEAHPLLKPLIDYLSKNNMTLGDMLMTPKAQDDQQLIKGYLDQDKNKAEAELEYRQRLEKQNSQLLQLIGNSYPSQEGEVIDVEPSRET